MTEHDPAHDELVSAHLDGESTPEEDERIAHEPALRARLDTFTQIRDAVAAPVPPPADEDRDALLARVVGTAIAPRPKVVAISTWQRVQTRVLGVAAAIIAVAFLGGAIVLLAGEGDGGGGDADSAAESATMSADADTTMRSSDPGADDQAGDDAAGSSAYTNPAPLDPVPLPGSFPDADALIDEVRAAASAPPEDDGSTAESAAPTTAAGAASCTRPGAERLYVADIDGRAVLVFVEPETITVLAAADCTTVASAARG
jgi:hypothetical protein